jgi:hypothetical protein
MSYKKPISALAKAQTLHDEDLLVIAQPDVPNPATGDNGVSASTPLDDLAGYVAEHEATEAKIAAAVGAEQDRAEGIEEGLRADVDSSVKKDIAGTMVEDITLPEDSVTATAVTYKKRSVTLADGTVQEVSMALPVSSGTQAGIVTAEDKGRILEIPQKVDQGEKGTAGGVATLNAYGRIPSSQIPASYDEILEFDDYDSFPQPGTAGKVYVALDTNLTYRWGGSAYAKIGQDLALGETEGTAYPGPLGKENAEAIAEITASVGVAEGIAQLDENGKVPAAQLPHSGGIEEAPSDGKQYARKDEAWAEAETGIDEAPEDGKQYARKDGAWDEVDAGTGGGIDEAPEDGKQYARKDGAWDELPDVPEELTGKVDIRTTAPGDPRDSRILNELDGKGPWIYNKKSGMVSYAGVNSNGDENGVDDVVELYSKLAPQFLGHFDTLGELQSGVPSPGLYDWYSVGTEEPFDCYQWIDDQWAYKGKNNEGSRLFADGTRIIYERPGENYDPEDPGMLDMELARIGDIAAGGSGGDGGIDEAPEDGKQYARKDGAWDEVETPDPPEVPIVTEINESSDDAHVPSAKAVHDFIFNFGGPNIGSGGGDNVTIGGRDLLTQMGASSVADAVTEIHQRVHAGTFEDLLLLDYIDLPSMNIGGTTIANNPSYENLRICIAGFNKYFDIGDGLNLQDHIVWAFKNCVAQKAMNSANDNAGGFSVSALMAYLGSDFLSALAVALGPDNNIYSVSRRVSKKGSGEWFLSAVWQPTELEVFGAQTYGDEIAALGGEPMIVLPGYQSGLRVKKFNGSAVPWWLATPYASGATHFCTVAADGTPYYGGASTSRGVAPCFCTS